MTERHSEREPIFQWSQCGNDRVVRFLISFYLIRNDRLVLEGRYWSWAACRPTSITYKTKQTVIPTLSEESQNRNLSLVTCFGICSLLVRC
jgi:hypothetical protein